MLLAAGVLTWMVSWLHEQSKNRKIGIEKQVNLAASGRGHRALFLLAFLAVVREGIELALFMLAARVASNPFQEIMGAVLGLGTAALLGRMLFAASWRLSLTRFLFYQFLAGIFCGWSGEVRCPRV